MRIGSVMWMGLKTPKERSESLLRDNPEQPPVLLYLPLSPLTTLPVGLLPVKNEVFENTPGELGYLGIQWKLSSFLITTRTKPPWAFPSTSLLTVPPTSSVEMRKFPVFILGIRECPKIHVTHWCERTASDDTPAFTTLSNIVPSHNVLMSMTDSHWQQILKKILPRPLL